MGGYVIYEGQGGRESERKEANKILEIGKQYKVIGGKVTGWSSEYQLEGIRGSFNTCMFSGSWEDHGEVMTLDFRRKRRG